MDDGGASGTTGLLVIRTAYLTSISLPVATGRPATRTR